MGVMLGMLRKGVLNASGGREDLTEKTASEQRPEGWEGEAPRMYRKRMVPAKEEQMQRP